MSRPTGGTTKAHTRLELVGTGAAYIRVSDDEQDTARQYAAIRAFEQRHECKIAKEHWFKDEGWARDKADKRPDFQRMLKLVDAGAVQWVVVDALDRFGTKDAHQLVHYLYRLREGGCKLYDASDKEWTGEDIATIITAVVAGDQSKGEQTSKSHRVLGAKIAYARAGEWQGGPVRLGFDVACYLRKTGEELWRVVLEGKDRRLKVYPDGRTERFDGRANFPKWQNEGNPSPEFLRLAPSRDKAKIAAAKSVFKRYATESISFTALAHYLTGLGHTTCFGGPFQSHHIEGMLEDPIYIGYYTYNRRHSGKFHRYAGDQVVAELNYDERQTKNAKGDWVQSGRLFPPLVDPKTWAAVEAKLGGVAKRTNAPRSADQYLAGLVYCGHCGKRMVTGASRRPLSKPRIDGSTGVRHEYFCGTYAMCCRAKKRHLSPCLRNGVLQETLDGYVERYLTEAGQRLELLTEDLDAGPVTGRLEDAELEHWRAFRDGIGRLTGYLAEHHTAAYNGILRQFEMPQEQGGPGPDDFVDAVVECYRANFDPDGVRAEIDRLEDEHTAVMEKWADLPTPRAKEKAKAQLVALEEKIEGLRQQAQDAAQAVADHYREVQDLQVAIANAKIAMKGGATERALRHRAQALRAVIHRIECRFEATGESGGGWGKKNARLVSVTIYPVVGDPVELSAPSKGTLVYTRAHSFIYRTRSGRTR